LWPQPFAPNSFGATPQQHRAHRNNLPLNEGGPTRLLALAVSPPYDRSGCCGKEAAMHRLLAFLRVRVPSLAPVLAVIGCLA
jgi:hypothetical protein